MESGSTTNTLPVTLEDSLILKKPPLKEHEIIQELDRYVKDYSQYNDDYLRMRKKMEEELKMPEGPCYITKELYNKDGVLMHVVGQGEFSGIGADGKPILLYDKRGLPKNADGGVRRFTLPEILEIQRKRTGEISNLPRKPKMVRRKQPKKNKNPPPRKRLDEFDDVVVEETERLRRLHERM